MSRTTQRHQEKSTPLEKCKDRLKSLRYETSKLKDQIRLNPEQQLSLTYSSEIANLQHQNDAFLIKIKQEKVSIEGLDGEIRELNKEIHEKRLKVNNDSEKTRRQANEIQKEIKTLENKIDKDLQIYNQSVARNSKLREKVNELRREKILYSNMYSQLSEEIAKKQEEMKNIEDKGYQALKEREEINKKIKGLKKESEKDQEIFKARWLSLEEVISQEKKNDDFFNATTLEPPSGTELTPAEPTQQSTLVQDKQQTQDKINHYDRALKDLEERSGIQSLSEVVKLYLSEEMQNFSLFNHVSELSNELEKLDLQNAETKSKIDEIQQQYEDFDLERQHKIEELKRQLESARLKEDKLNKQLEKTNKTVATLVSGISTMFELMDIDPATAQVTQEEGEINEKNMEQCFGLIEAKFNEYLEPPDIEANRDIIRKIELEVPAVNERELPEDEEYILPLTSDEIRYKSLKRLSEENEKRFRRNR